MIKEDQIKLLSFARHIIGQHLRTKGLKEFHFKPTESMKSPSGAFVTIKNQGKLRGCIGRITSDQELWETVQNMAVAACNDSRFAPLEASEFEEIDIEISVLSPPKRIHSIDEVIIGRHGVIVKQGFSRGTLLPQVAPEQGWDAEELLGYCSRDKAGIGWDGWRFAEVYTYEAEVFSEKQFFQ